jgi:tetratricopeptide (TPR) repeat protein
MNSSALIERLGRASRVSGLLMALGALVVAVALWLSYAQLRALQADVNSLASEATRLEKQNSDLRQDAEKMRREMAGLREALAASRYAIEAFHQRDYSTAVSFYDQALRADPSNAYLLNLKAYSLFKLNRVGEAIDVQRQSLRADPEYAWGYFDLARFQCAAGRLDEARRAGFFDDARQSIASALERRPGLRAIMAKDGEFQKLCGPVLK